MMRKNTNISGELADWLEDQQMDHFHGASYHPQTQGKIGRWRQALKNRILLESYYLPDDLRRQINAFLVKIRKRVEHCVHLIDHESGDELWFCWPV